VGQPGQSKRCPYKPPAIVPPMCTGFTKGAAERVNTMTDKPKKEPRYTVDFVTALSPAACCTRLEQCADAPIRVLGGTLAPVTQRTTVQDNDLFLVEREFPGAMRPIRLVGHLDPDEDGDGTWVHGAVTVDAENQVWIEGLFLFGIFFLMAALFFLRLKTRGFFVSVPLFLLLLTLFALRWRALRATTEDLARWLRRRLYVTAEQVRNQSS
jgi:hypothetical protein